jgi:Tfp pilus assembly PilM family ATPase
LYQFYIELPTLFVACRAPFLTLHFFIIGKENSLKFLSFLSSPLVGVDVQPDGMRLVQLTRWPWGYHLEAAVHRPLPSGVFSEGKIKRWDRVGMVLEEMVHQYNLGGMPAVITLPANLVRMQRLVIPLGLSAEAIKGEIETHIQKEWPGVTEALNIDFIYLEGKQNIFFAAVRQEYVTQYMACVNAAGLSTKMADVDVYALKRVLQAVREASEVTHAILHVMKNGLSFTVFKGQEIIFHQYIEGAHQKELLLQLKARIEAYLSTVYDIAIKRIAICASNDAASRLMGPLKALGYEVYYPNLFQTVKFASHLDQGLISDQAASYGIAFGAAMREVPQWVK